MIEIFEPESYLFPLDKIKSKKDLKIINRCNLYFKRGIILNHKLLYFLIKGNYAESEPIKKENFFYSDDERISYKSLIILLNKIKTEIGKKYLIFITPHIFTKFINELRKGVIDSKHFSNILTSFIEDFGYIKEEELKKEEIINVPHFKSRFVGLSETASILLKDKLGEICIIDTIDSKILNMERDNYLFIEFPRLVDVIRKYEDRNKII